MTNVASANTEFSPSNWFSKTCVANAIKDINQIEARGDKDYFYPNPSSFYTSKEYRKTLVNRFGLDNHFQGIIYDEIENYHILSGANANLKIKTGSLFISSYDKFSGTYQLSKRLDLKTNNGLWHAGGLAKFGPYVLIPVERFFPTEISEIQFYDFKNKNNPKKLSYSIEIKDHKTGAVDLIYNPKDQLLYLFAFDTKNISIFRADPKDIKNKFKFYKKIKTRTFSGSNIKVVQQCNGDLFLADLTNNGILPPFLNYKDRLVLYQLNEKQGSIKAIGKKDFKCDGFCNFRGAASINSYNNKLTILSSKMYRESKKNIIKFNVFSNKSK